VEAGFDGFAICIEATGLVRLFTVEQTTEAVSKYSFFIYLSDVILLQPNFMNPECDNSRIRVRLRA